MAVEKNSHYKERVNDFNDSNLAFKPRAWTTGYDLSYTFEHWR